MTNQSTHGTFSTATMEEMKVGPCEMTPDEARTYYDRIAERYWAIYDSHFKDITQVVDAVELRSTDFVLDLGTGLGWVAARAARECFLAVGLDISPRMVDEAIRLNNLPNAHFGVANMLDAHAIHNATTPLVNSTANIVRFHEANIAMPFANPPKFDVVFVCAALNHIAPEHQSGFLEMIHRELLVPEGRIVLYYEGERDEMYPMEVSYVYQKAGTDDNITDSACRRRVGDRESEESVSDELSDLAQYAGLHVEGYEVLNRHPIWGYQNYVRTVTAEAINMSLDTPEPGFDELKVARYAMFCELEAAFERSTVFPHPRNGIATEGLPVWHARYKPTTLIAVLERASEYYARPRPIFRVRPSRRR